MALVLIQVYRIKKAERNLWRSFALAWLRRGYRPVFWSNFDQGTLGLTFLPFVASEWEHDLYQTTRKNPLTCETLKDRWRQRAAAVRADYGFLPYHYDPERMLPLQETILQVLRPEVFLVWAGIEPGFQIPRDVANDLSIPNLVIEKGLVGPTKLMDFGGMMGLSELCRPTLEELLETGAWEEAAIRGKHFLGQWTQTFIPRAPMPGGFNIETELSVGSGKPKIVVLGCFDLATGASYPDELKSASLPGYRDGFDIALEAARRLDADVVYKPHPNEPSKPSWSERPDNLLITSKDVRQVIQWADIAIGYGSTVDLHAAAVGKPLVLAGRSFLLNKGIAFEALRPEDLPGAVAAALKRENWPERRRRLDVFIGYLLSEYLFNDVPGGPASMSAADAVDKIVNRLGLKPSFPLSRRETLRRCDELLSLKGKKEIRSRQHLDRLIQTACTARLLVARASVLLASKNASVCFKLPEWLEGAGGVNKSTVSGRAAGKLESVIQKMRDAAAAGGHCLRIIRELRRQPELLEAFRCCARSKSKIVGYPSPSRSVRGGFRLALKSLGLDVALDWANTCEECQANEPNPIFLKLNEF